MRRRTQAPGQWTTRGSAWIWVVVAAVWAFTPLGEGTRRWPLTVLYLVLAAFVRLYPSGTWVAAPGLQVGPVLPNVTQAAR